MDFIPCSYIGQRTADGRRFDGIGRYTFANGDVYVGGMKDGQFHGQGVLFFRSTTPALNDPPSGSATISAQKENNQRADDELKAFFNPSVSTPAASTDEGWSGQYRGIWDQGHHIEGQYVFQDGLIHGNKDRNQGDVPPRFSSTEWTYCHGSDRRLWDEYLKNVAPVLPHEALLGGAKLLHERKHAAAAEPTSESNTAAAQKTNESGEGLPLVLPNAFVQAREAPAFAAGQLCGVNDARVVRWTAAAVADEAAKRQQRSTASPLTSSPEMVESTIALQLAVSHTTTGLSSQTHQKEGAALRDTQVTGETKESSSHAKLNLSVCRVKDVEDVNRALVQVVPAPS